jgi:hypothetical protein
MRALFIILALGLASSAFAEYAQVNGGVCTIEQQGHGRTADIDRPLSYDQMAEDTALDSFKTMKADDIPQQFRDAYAKSAPADLKSIQAPMLRAFYEKK